MENTPIPPVTPEWLRRLVSTHWATAAWVSGTTLFALILGVSAVFLVATVWSVVGLTLGVRWGVRADRREKEVAQYDAAMGDELAAIERSILKARKLKRRAPITVRPDPHTFPCVICGTPVPAGKLYCPTHEEAQ